MQLKAGRLLHPANDTELTGYSSFRASFAMYPVQVNSSVRQLDKMLGTKLGHLRNWTQKARTPKIPKLPRQYLGLI